MLPELAWSLQPGELVKHTSPIYGIEIVGRVLAVCPYGASVEKFVRCGFEESVALKLQHDGPTIIIDNGSDTYLCRPDNVERISKDYNVSCGACGCVVPVRLSLRVFDRIHAGEPLVHALEDLDTIHRAMIIQGRCGAHCHV